MILMSGPGKARLAGCATFIGTGSDRANAGVVRWPPPPLDFVFSTGHSFGWGRRDMCELRCGGIVRRQPHEAPAVGHRVQDIGAWSHVPDVTIAAGGRDIRSGSCTHLIVRAANVVGRCLRLRLATYPAARQATPTRCDHPVESERVENSTPSSMAGRSHRDIAPATCRPPWGFLRDPPSGGVMRRPMVQSCREPAWPPHTHLRKDPRT